MERAKTLIEIYVLTVFALSHVFVVTAGVPRQTGSAFLTEPDNVTKVFEHGSTNTYTVTLKCQTGNEISIEKMSWMKNGVVITEDSTVVDGPDTRRLVDPVRYSIEVDTGGKYNLHIVAVSIYTAWLDEGVYQCAAFMSVGGNTEIAYSRTSHVTIYRTPRESHPFCLINNTATEIFTNVTEGDVMELGCFSDHGVPPVILEWRKDDAKLPVDVGQSDGLLFSKYEWRASRRDSDAIFTCLSHHPGFNTDKTCTIGPLDVLYQPDVILNPAEHEITRLYSAVSFTCVATGNPAVSDAITWQYDDSVIDENNFRFKIEEGRRKLTLSNFSVIDNGIHIIKCIAQNDVGVGTAVGLVTVNIPYTTRGELTTVAFRENTTTVSKSLTKTTPSVDANSRHGNSIITIIALSSALGAMAVIALMSFIIVFACLCYRRRNIKAEQERQKQDTKSNVNCTPPIQRRTDDVELAPISVDTNDNNNHYAELMPSPPNNHVTYNIYHIYRTDKDTVRGIEQMEHFI